MATTEPTTAAYRIRRPQREGLRWGLFIEHRRSVVKTVVAWTPWGAKRKANRWVADHA